MLLKRFTPLLVIIGITLLFFYKLAFTDLILARGDTFVYFYPYWDARDDALSNGDLPLWTPDLFMGAPLLANPQVGTLYPPNWLTISFSAPDAVRISVLLHVAWGMLGAYLLARRSLKLDVIPALAAGSIFAFGGYMGSHVEQINQLQGLAWFPWLFLLFGLSLKRPRWIILFGAAWAMQILSGHTQTVFMAGVALGIYALEQIYVYGKGMIDHAPTHTEPNVGAQYIAPSEQSPSIKREHGSAMSLRVIYPPLVLMLAVLFAVALASPQLIPAQELVSLSNRGGGLNTQEATAFSLNPFLFGRGMLPSYDAQPFGEYIGYIGIIGLGLAIFGVFARHPQRRVWILMAFAGLFLAFGRHNPLYLLLAELPGFNLFRVPSRWLALWTMGASMLAGLGMQGIQTQTVSRRGAIYCALVFITVIAFLAGTSLLSNRAADEVDGSAIPTLMTCVGWGAAVVGFVAIVYRAGLKPAPTDHSVSRRGMIDHALMTGFRKAQYIAPLLLTLLLLELFLASSTLPYNDLTDPAVYNDSRFPINQMQVYGEQTTPSGRLLSISGLLFDPGDKAALQQRWERMGLSERAARYAFTATKIQETITGNLPLTWGIPSIDGYEGGVLPTLYYTQFTSLLLPEGTLRTTDGRLREVLAKPECRGACIPDDRWLDLMNVQYLMTDKVYDLVHEGIFYDTQLTLDLSDGESVTLEDFQAFESTGLHVLYVCADGNPCSMNVEFDGESLEKSADEIVLDGLQLGRFRTPPLNPLPHNGEGTSNTPDHQDSLLPCYEGRRAEDEGVDLRNCPAVTPSQITLSTSGNIRIYALSLVDARTGNFIQLTPPGWERVFSGDVKIYENLDVMPRAFVVHDAVVFPDTWDGSEQALNLMRDPSFDPRETVTINSDNMAIAEFAASLIESEAQSTVSIRYYLPTQMNIEVDSAEDGFLILTDAFYPGWEISGLDPSLRTPIYRGDVMFRAIPIHKGNNSIYLRYNEPEWWTALSCLMVVIPCSLPFLALILALIVTSSTESRFFYRRRAR